MSNIILDIREVLTLLVNNLLPAGSGREKVLEITLLLRGESKKYIRIIIHRPKSYVLVSYKLGQHLDLEYTADNENFAVTANHDSTWRYDGFDFLRRFPEKDIEVLIKSSDIVEIQNPIFHEKEKKFSFTRKIK